MRQSRLFTKTLRHPPKDEESPSAQLLERGGFIQKHVSGAYNYLPLGWRVIRKLERIIRKEMNAIGGEELFMTALQDPAVWKATDRWDDDAVDIWFKTQLQSGADLGLAYTHEEPITQLMRRHISSYRDLPVYAYQFQTKFRNELRAKGGLLRVREFIMKDLYSFNRSHDALDAFYEEAKEAYATIFDRVGIGDETFVTFASGGSFSKFSHEFQTVSDVGEDTIYLDKEKEIAVNKEVFTDEVLDELGLDRDALTEVNAIEVGNIFKLGTRFSEALGLTYLDENGNEELVVMGSYGIGPGRLMATVVEVFHDADGIIWPDAVAPFQVHLLAIAGDDDPAVSPAAEAVYDQLTAADVEVLFDDRGESAGTAFADADLIGIPYRVVVSPTTVAQDNVEVKRRDEEEEEMMSVEELIDRLVP